MKLAFEHLNLWRNPFGELPPEEWRQLAVVDVERFLERLARPGQVVEFLGLSGRGKTTHLRALWGHFPQAPFLSVAEEAEDLLFRPDSELLFIDEAQFLTRSQQRALFQSHRSYVVGTHRRLKRTYRRAGLAFETMEVGGIDPDALDEMIRRRIEASRRRPGPVPTVAPPVLEALIEDHGDNLRALEHHLYEVFQRLPEIKPIDLDLL